MCRSVEVLTEVLVHGTGEIGRGHAAADRLMSVDLKNPETGRQ